MNEDKEILTAEPVEFGFPDYDIIDELANPQLLSVETSREVLEDEMLRAYLQMLRDRESKDRIKAASDIAEILGHKGKRTTVFAGENLQINNQTNNLLPEEMRKHLLGASAGLKALTESSDAQIKIKGGGNG